MQEQNPNQLQNENIEIVQEPVVNSNPVVEPVVTNEGGIPEVGESVSVPTPVTPVEQPSPVETPVPPVETPVEQATTVSAPLPKKSPVGIIVILAVVVIAIVAVYFIFIKGNSNNTNQTPNTPAVSDKTDDKTSTDEQLSMSMIDKKQASDNSSVIVSGFIEKGSVKVGDKLETYSLHENWKKIVTVSKIEVDGKSVDSVSANEHQVVDITVGKDITEMDVGLGLVPLNSIEYYEEFEANFTPYTPEQAKENASILTGNPIGKEEKVVGQIYAFINSLPTYGCKIEVLDANGIEPGSTGKVNVKLDATEGKVSGFVIRKKYIVKENGGLIGELEITKFIK